jgi:hypothetical protein
VSKASHASGGVILVGDGADPATRIPSPSSGFVRVAVHPPRVDWNEAITLTDRWLSTPFDPAPAGEWAYSQVLLVVARALLHA